MATSGQSASHRSRRARWTSGRSRRSGGRLSARRRPRHLRAHDRPSDRRSGPGRHAAPPGRRGRVPARSRRIRPATREPLRALGFDQYGELDAGPPPHTRHGTPACRGSRRRSSSSARVGRPSRLPGGLHPGEADRTVAQRRRAFRGVLGGAVAVDRLRSSSRAQLPGRRAFRVSDGDRVSSRGRPTRATRTVPAFGRRWEVGVVPGDDLVARRFRSSSPSAGQCSRCSRARSSRCPGGASARWRPTASSRDASPTVTRCCSTSAPPSTSRGR